MKKDNPSDMPKELFPFLKWVFIRIHTQGKWWLIPFWLILLAIGLVLFLTGNGHLLPAIYIAF